MGNLEICNLTKVYNHKTVVDDISFTVNDGEYDIDDSAWVVCNGGGNKGIININGGSYKQSRTNVIGFRSGTLNINDGTFTMVGNYPILINVVIFLQNYMNQ